MSKLEKDSNHLDRLVPTTDELLSETIDGETYGYLKSPLCKVCSGDESIRRLVDTLLLFPKSYKDTLTEVRLIEEKLEVAEGDRLSYHSIRNHYLNHLPADKKAVREIVERRATIKGKKIIDSGGTLLTPEAFYEVVVAKGFDNIVNGLDAPTISQTMQAVNMLKRLEEETVRDYKPEHLLNQLNIIVMAIREVLPEEMRDAVFKKIDEYSKDSTKAVTALELSEAIEYIDEDLSLE